jgi:CheY-like chemotaxis protein
MLTRLHTRLVEAGFRHFHTTVAGAASLAGWICALWIGWLAHGAWPPAVALVALPLLYGLTYGLLRSERRPLPAPARRTARFLVGCSFTSIFSALALGATAVLWGAARLSLDTLAVQAGGIDPGGTYGSARDVIDPLFRSLGSVAMAASALALAYGYTAGQRQVEITRRRVPVRGLPEELSGLRIVQISDLHIGPYLPPAQLDAYVDCINGLEPDLVCVTGDIIDNRYSYPDLDGVATAQRVRREPTTRDVPIIALTSISRSLSAQEERAFAALLPKPIKQSQLLDAILLSGRRQATRAAAPLREAGSGSESESLR